MRQHGHMRFVLIRHGQSSNNLLWEQTGASMGRHHDSPLTDLGHLQAQRLAETVAAGALPWSITQLHSSLMTRAIQTAAPLAEALDLPLHGHLEAHELGGVFTEDEAGVRTVHPGGTSTELMELTARLVLPGIGADGWFTGPVEDDPVASAERALRVVADLRERHDEDDVVALVMHGAFFQHLFRALLGIETMSGWVVKHNTAISLFADEPGLDSVTAHALDWMPHLTSDLVTL